MAEKEIRTGGVTGFLVMDNSYLDLFSGNVKRLKVNGNGQASGLCPFHDDKTPSFSVNTNTGVWNCRGCGLDGNAITFLELLNLAPTNHRQERGSENLSTKQLETIDWLAAYLQDNLESLHTSGRIPVFWTANVLKQTRTGFDSEKNCLTFTHFNIDGLPVNIKWHKPVNGESSQIPGHGQTRLYPLHLFRDYSIDKPLIYCEGEKDCISLLSMGLQAVTHTCGALSVPDDLTHLKDFKKIYIVFDNDPAGHDGAENTAIALSRSFPEMKVYIYDWQGKTPSGFDVTDYFSNGGNVSGFKHMMDYAFLYENISDEPREGFIKVCRKITDSRIFKNPELLQTWLYCQLEASHKRTFVDVKCGIGHKQIALERGQFVLSLDIAHRITKQPVNSLKYRLKILENMGEIKQSKQNVRTIVTICKWRLYQ